MIIHDDFRTALKRLPSHSVPCVITSPPFWTAHGGPEWGGESEGGDYLRRFAELGAALLRVLHPTGTLWLVLGQPFAALSDLAVLGWHVASTSAWGTSVVAQLHRTPDHPPLAAHAPYDAIITDQPYAPLSRRFIRRCVHASTQEGDLILDPCCGSGTVGIVAVELNRRFIGIEVDEATCSLARARNSVTTLQMLQKKPIKWACNAVTL